MNQMTLRAARVNAGYKQSEVAEKLGVNVSTVGNWERCKTYPDVAYALRLCELYGLHYDQVKFLPDNPQNADNEVMPDADT